MPTRFGLRDLVIVLAVLGIGVIGILLLVRQDRLFRQQQQLIAALSTGDALASSRLAIPTPNQPSSGADSWARPDVPITTLQPPRRTGMEVALGGTIVEALESEPRTLTPLFATDAQARRVILENVCQTLARTARYGGSSLDRCLATAYQADPAGLWLRVRLDDRARFSDGTPVTAADVRFSLDILRTPGLDAARTSTILSGIDRVEVIADRVAEFHFIEPRPLNVTHALCSLLILPKHFYERYSVEDLNQSTGLLMGSGPFMVRPVGLDTQWKPGSDITLPRNPLAWEESPSADALRFMVITDAGARLTALKNGDIHIMRPTPDQVRSITESPYNAADPRVVTSYTTGSSFSAIAWNCGNRGDAPSIVADARIRSALTSLVDRRRIVDEFYAGVATIADHPFPINTSMRDYSIKPLPFDPPRATALLDEAGWTARNAEGIRVHADGRTLEIDLAIPQGSKLGEFVSLMLKDEAAKAGIRIRIATADMAAIGAMHRSGDFDGTLVAWVHGLPETEPRHHWHSASIRSGDNFTRFANSDADTIIELGERTLDLGTRMQLWQRLHRVLHTEQPCTFLVNPTWVRLTAPNLSVSTDFYGIDYAGSGFVAPREPSR
jgi:peptide/nickel transport system substrate-binding protein